MPGSPLSSGRLFLPQVVPACGLHPLLPRQGFVTLGLLVSAGGTVVHKAVVTLSRDTVGTERLLGGWGSRVAFRGEVGDNRCVKQGRGHSRHV